MLGNYYFFQTLVYSMVTVSFISHWSKGARCSFVVRALTARVLLYALSHRQDNTYNSLCYTSRGALAQTRNSPMGPPWRIDPMTHERTLLPRSYISLPLSFLDVAYKRSLAAKCRDVIPCDMVTFCDKTCLPEILWHVMTFWEFCDKMWQSGQ